MEKTLNFNHSLADFKLAVFDMDSTLITIEVIDELAKMAGVGDQVIAITESAMRGELDFDQSLKARVKLLAGFPESRLEDLAKRLPLTAGASELLTGLKQAGYITAILSGGFTYFAKVLQQQLGFDYVHSNQLEVSNGRLTGNVVGDIVNAEYKAKMLKQIATQHQIPLHQTIAVGDGANDILMLQSAGLGVAFHAKPIVVEAVEYHIESGGLDTLLHALKAKNNH